MKMKAWILAMGIGLAFAGCVPSEPPAVEPPNNGGTDTGTDEQQMALAKEWFKAAKEYTGLQSDPEPAREIARQLAPLAPDALLPILDLMGAAESSPYIRVLAVQCVSPFMTPEYMTRLGRLLGSSKDQTVRACAATLLGKIDDPGIAPMLQKLVDDPETERRVSFSARVGLARWGDEGVRQELCDLFSAPTSTIDEMDQVLRLLLENPEKGDLPTLAEAIRSEVVLPTLKMESVLALGRMGDASSLDSLRQALEKPLDDASRSVFESAIAAIEEREKAASLGP